MGDPLQKRNYYRAGWLRFRDDADMPRVMSELTDKKVCLILALCGVGLQFIQIEGFKLHVSHITKPFTSRVRFAPEVASKPDRLVKDLEQAKALAAVLEEEYDTLAKMKIEPPKPEANGGGLEGEPKVEAQDTVMSHEEEIHVDDSEPRERGTDAVERRIEKVMAEMLDQGIVNANDEKAVEAKRVRTCLTLLPYWS